MPTKTKEQKILEALMDLDVQDADVVAYELAQNEGHWTDIVRNYFKATKGNALKAHINATRNVQ